MTEKHQYDRKKLIILRAALIAIGAGVGGTALWQYFAYFPDIVRREYQIVITVVSAALTALLLALSAKPIYRLGAGIAESVSGVAVKLGAKGVIGVVLGLVAAGALVVAVDVIMSTYQDIWAVRLLVDMLAYLVFAALCCYGFIRWLSEPEETEAPIESKKQGYLLSYKCFMDERVITAADTLINACVCDSAYKAICLFGGDAEAVKRLDSLVSCGAVKPVHVSKQFSDENELDEIEKSYARSKRLKYLSAEGAEPGISVFCAPDDATREKYIKAPTE